jgi:hypothetical protein
VEVWCRFPSAIHRTLITFLSYSHLVAEFSMKLFKVDDEFVGCQLAFWEDGNVGMIAFVSKERGYASCSTGGVVVCEFSEG